MCVCVCECGGGREDVHKIEVGCLKWRQRHVAFDASVT